MYCHYDVYSRIQQQLHNICDNLAEIDVHGVGTGQPVMINLVCLAYNSNGWLINNYYISYPIGRIRVSGAVTHYET